MRKRQARSRARRHVLSAFLAALLAFAMVGCTQPATNEGTDIGGAEVTTTESGTVIVTDDAGRDVEIPSDLTRIAPSGPLAQLVLYTLCPDKIVGLGQEVSVAERVYVDADYANLPVFGNFYDDSLNLEAVMVAETQIVIDIGEPKETVKDDMQGVQDKTGIPSIFIRMELDNMPEAYRTIGKIVGEEQKAEELAAYIEATLQEAKDGAASISEADRKTVYYGQGEGLTAVVAGTVHSDVIDIVGGVNVAVVEESVRGGASEISMEQMMLWNPEVILFAPDSIYGTVANAPEWAEVAAVKSSTYYEVPVGPYNWMGRPPSVNRIIGVKWLGNLLYPEVFDYDMVAETKEFYSLFYHCDLTDAQVNDLLAKSTYK